MMRRTVGIVGAGTMGAGIAQVFARAGWSVSLIDEEAGKLHEGLAAIELALQRRVTKGELTREEATAIFEQILPGTEIAGSLHAADLVVEAATEKDRVKAEIFRMLDEEVRADAVLASNTSSLSITWLGAQTSRPERVVGMHFFNPAPKMTLVEVVRGMETSQESVDYVVDVAKALGKTPIVVEDSPGFVSNRILMPMINEAFYCLMDRVSGAEQIDQVMKLGMAHPMGPLALADLIGLDVCLSILEVLHRDLGDDKYRPCPLLRKFVAAGRLGRKTRKGVYDYATET